MRGLIIASILVPLLCVIMVVFTPVDRPIIPNPPPIQPQPQPQPQAPKPGDKVNWIEFKARKNLKDDSWGDCLTDIENHPDSSLGTHYRDKDRSTWAHETTHGINGWMNNNLQKSRTHYHLYVGNDKAVAIKQPNFKISDVASIVPRSLQKSRYQLYLIKQQSGWNKEPIYLWDEWVAYCNGAQCGIELVNKDKYKPSKNDSGWGVLEFSVYATYVAIAQKKHDPSYDNGQMLEFLAWNLERGMKIYREGQKLEVYNWDDNKYLDHLTTSSDAEEFRKFLIDTYGKDWTNKVFGF